MRWHTPTPLLVALTLLACGSDALVSVEREDEPRPAVSEPQLPPEPEPEPEPPIVEPPPSEPPPPEPPPVDPPPPIEPPPACAPSFTDEVKIADWGLPEKALWDGQHFMVVVNFDGASVVGRRVALDGRIVDAAPGFALDPAYGDIDFGEGKYVMVTNEPPSGDITSPLFCEFQQVAYRELSPEGAPLTEKRQALCAQFDLAWPRVAANPRGGMMIVATNTSASVGRIWSASGAPVAFERFHAPGFDPSFNYRVMKPNVIAFAGGYAVAAQDQHYWSGCPDEECANPVCPEIWGKTFDDAGRATSAWRQLVNITQGFACDTANQLPALAYGTEAFLLGSGSHPPTTGHSVQMTRVSVSYSPGLVNVFDDPSPLNQESTPVVFDGTNFIAVPSTQASYQLRAYRFAQSGERLDVSPMQLAPLDGQLRSQPQLASNRAGRQLVAYKKTSDGAVYVRLFSTCP